MFGNKGERFIAEINRSENEVTISVSEKKKGKNFVLSVLKDALIFYIIISFFRFFVYKEKIFSMEPAVMGTAIAVALLLVVLSWLKSVLRFPKEGKRYRYFLSPIGTALLTYVFFTSLRYAVWQEALLTMNIEVIMVSIMSGIFEGFGAKVDDISPRDPRKEPSRPIKYYIDKFIINATPFHKIMLVVYGFCILLIIGVFLLAL